MQVILKETIDTLGEEGDVVKVKDGYARNYLLPKNLAAVATEGNVAVLAKQKAAIEARKKEQRATAESLAKKLGNLTVTIAQRTGDDGKLFGSVTAADIAANLAEQGVTIDKKTILLDEPIKSLGSHTVAVKAGYQVKGEVKVEVVALTAEE